MRQDPAKTTIRRLLRKLAPKLLQDPREYLDGFLKTLCDLFTFSTHSVDIFLGRPPFLLGGLHKQTGLLLSLSDDRLRL